MQAKIFFSVLIFCFISFSCAENESINHIKSLETFSSLNYGNDFWLHKAKELIQQRIEDKRGEEKDLLQQSLHRLNKKILINQNLLQNMFPIFPYLIQTKYIEIEGDSLESCCIQALKNYFNNKNKYPSKILISTLPKNDELEMALFSYFLNNHPDIELEDEEKEWKNGAKFNFREFENGIENFKHVILEVNDLNDSSNVQAFYVDRVDAMNDYFYFFILLFIFCFSMPFLVRKFFKNHHLSFPSVVVEIDTFQFRYISSSLGFFSSWIVLFLQSFFFDFSSFYPELNAPSNYWWFPLFYILSFTILSPNITLAMASIRLNFVDFFFESFVFPWVLFGSGIGCISFVFRAHFLLFGKLRKTFSIFIFQFFHLSIKK